MELGVKVVPLLEIVIVADSVNTVDTPSPPVQLRVVVACAP